MQYPGSGSLPMTVSLIVTVLWDSKCHESQAFKGNSLSDSPNTRALAMCESSPLTDSGTLEHSRGEVQRQRSPPEVPGKVYHQRGDTCFLGSLPSAEAAAGAISSQAFA